MGISFGRPSRRSAGLSAWRPVVVTTGAAAVGAAVLAGAASSGSLGTAPQAQAQPTVASMTVVSDTQSLAEAQAVAGSNPVLYGFAPPAEAGAAAAAQFRLAANLPDGPLGIPGVVLQAYKLAATRVAAETPECKLPWFLLAGIGRIESGHAGNGNVDAFGNSRTAIRGPMLDGSLAGNEVIRDSDGGGLDGDVGHDRAMGPMQFIPSTWKAWGSDANGDGKANPDNIFDATYSAGRYLCSGVSDIMNDATKVNNILRYNRSVAYANNVLGWAAAYATGVVPTEGIPEMSHAPATGPDSDEAKKDKKDGDKKDGDRAGTKPGEDRRAPGQPGPNGEAPDADPSTKAKPKPQQQCLGGICLPPGVLPAPAPQKPAPQKQAPKKQDAPKPDGAAPTKQPATKQPATKRPAAH